ncbi:MAG: NUDIX domain-containing protein [Clostridia bacterium]|nr:NUDIX domain-containing protein [Clostridia bacterium]
MISPDHPDPEDLSLTPDLRPMTAIYLTRGDKVLLLYRIGSRVVGNSYTGSAGGHMEPDEISSARACVLRELQEETGLTSAALDHLQMRYATMRLKNGEIRQNYYFFAELRDEFDLGSSNEGRLQWFDLTEVDDLPMPFTAKYVIQHYVKTGRHTQLLYGGLTTENGVCFIPLEEF